MIVVFTEEAEADLETIGDFIARDNPRRAIAFVDELVEKCATLSASPRRFAVLPDREATGIRRYPYRDYLIFTGWSATQSRSFIS